MDGARASMYCNVLAAIGRDILDVIVGARTRRYCNRFAATIGRVILDVIVGT